MEQRLARGATLVLTALVAATTAAAQEVRPNYAFYFGGQGGTTIFKTASQTRGAVPAFGGHVLAMAKRAGLMVSVEEAVGSNERAALSDPQGAGGRREFLFNDVRTYSFVLMAFPIRTRLQPYVGVGAGMIEAVNPRPLPPFADPNDQARIEEAGSELGSSGVATFVAGAQYAVSIVDIFAQYQITSSSPNGSFDRFRGSLIRGPTHKVMAGLRIRLASGRDRGYGTKTEF